MSGLYLPEAEDDEVARDQFLNYSVSSTSAVLGATFEETFYYNPFMSGMRNIALRGAQKRGEVINKEDWKNSEDYRDGLNYPEAGLTKAAAMFIADGFDERKERKEVFSRGRGGFAMGAAKFGVALVGSALDPLNIGASFLPGAAVRTFVNARRATKAVGGAAIVKGTAFQAGKTKKRFLAGAGEGVAGAALVEPIILNTAELEQDKDYTLLDSFLNVTIGGVLGGGLHAIGGKFSDRMQKARRETVEALIRTAVAQKVQGKAVNIKPIINADPNLTARKHDPRNQEPKIVNYANEESVVRTLDDMEKEFDSDVKVKGTKLPDSLKVSPVQPRSLASWFRKNKVNSDDRNIPDLKAELGDGHKAFKNKKGESLDNLAREATDQGYFDIEPTEAQFIQAIKDDLDGIRKYKSQDLDTVEANNDIIELRAKADELGVKYKGVKDEDFIAAIKQHDELNAYHQQMLAPEDSDGIPGYEYNEAMSDADAAYMNYQDEMVDVPEVDIFSSNAPVIRDLDLKELDIEQQQLLNEVEHYQKSDLITEHDAEQIKLANEDVQRAETSFQSAAEAAARCLVR